MRGMASRPEEAKSMTAKQYLRDALYGDICIAAKAEEAARLRALAERCTGAISERVQASPENAREDVYVRLIEASIEKEKEANAILDQKLRLSAKLTLMEDKRFSELLRLKYICGKTWEEIGEITHYDESTMRKLHGAALKAFERECM